MNRVQGDYFEKLLYKIFVSIDGHTTVLQLADMLQIDIALIKVVKPPTSLLLCGYHQIVNKLEFIDSLTLFE